MRKPSVIWALLFRITWLVSSKTRNLNPNVSDFQARFYNLEFHQKNLGECFRVLVSLTLAQGREKGAGEEGRDKGQDAL